MAENLETKYETEDIDRRRLQETMETTVGQDCFSAEEIQKLLKQAEEPEHQPDSEKTIDDALPSIEKIGLHHEFAARIGAEISPEAKHRYQIRELLGIGSWGNVFSAYDSNLDRLVAIKTLKEPFSEDESRQRRFMREAGMSAKLDHPGILPIYDADVDANGKIYYTMKPVEGRSLGEFIDDAVSSGKKIPSEEIVRIFIAVTEALAFAHSKGVIHQDIKPQNIMIGEYGEVMIADWGTASRLENTGSGKMMGTPAYMSPEQARRETADDLSDQYCTGASLFHALTGRHPIRPEASENFWEKKRKGDLDLPDSYEQKSVSPQLLAIALKALHADPAERYSNMKSMAQDLRNYQNGLALSAYRDSFVSFLYRWYARNKTLFWSSAAVLAVVLISFSFFYNLKLKQIAKWGKDPVVFEDFEDDSWKEDWISPDNNDWKVENGRLITQEGGSFYLYYNKPFYGPVTVEFEGEMIPDNPECDLSIAWVSELDPEKEGVKFLFQTGAFDNSYTAITQKSAFGKGKSVTQAYSELKLKSGVVYTIRAEIDRNELTLFVDGKEVCSYESVFPLSRGYVGLYAYYSGKAFDNIRIHSKGVAEMVSVTGVGDRFFEKNLLSDAHDEYHRVTESHKGKPVAEEALYKMGLCRFIEGRSEEAYAYWEELLGTTQHLRVSLHLIERDFIEEKYEKVLTAVEQLYRSYGKQDHQRIVVLMNRLLTLIYKTGWIPVKTQKKFLTLGEELFKGDGLFSHAAARLSNRLGEYQHTMDRYKEHEYYQGLACFQTGQYEKLLNEYPNARFWASYALLVTGQGERVLTEYPVQGYTIARYLCSAGRVDEALERFKDDEKTKALIYHIIGDHHKVVEDYTDNSMFYPQSLIALGREDEIGDEYRVTGSREYVYARMIEALSEMIEGDLSKGTEMAVRAQEYMLTYLGKGYPKIRMLWTFPVVRKLKCENIDLKAEYRRIIDTFPHISINPGIAAEYRYLLGEMTDQQFLGQKEQFNVQVRFTILKAVCEDLKGRDTALSLYKNYLKTPEFRKPYRFMVFYDRIARWRIKELSASPVK